MPAGPSFKAPTLHDDLDSILWPQRHRRQQAHWMLRQEREPESLTDSRQQQHDLHHCKVISNAGAWSAAEREVSVLRQRVAKVFSPAFRIEAIRLIEESRIALYSPMKHEYLCFGGHSKTTNFTFLNRLPPQRVCRRIKPHRLFCDHLRVLQLR